MERKAKRPYLRRTLVSSVHHCMTNALGAANATNEGVSIDVVLLFVLLALAANMALAPRRARAEVRVAGRSARGYAG